MSTTDTAPSVIRLVTVIVTAFATAEPGSVLIPPVRAMKLVDVAKAAVGENVPIKIIGERPGEKLDETLLHYEESVRVVLREDGDKHWYEILSPGQRVGEKPFTIASHSPQYLISPIEMRECIADAAEV